MAVSPIGNVIYANQSSPVASHAQQQAQGRIDFQNMMTSELAQEKKLEIERTRPAEESSKLDPDREHQRDREDQKEENQKEARSARENEPEPFPRLLDIKV